MASEVYEDGARYFCTWCKQTIDDEPHCPDVNDLSSIKGICGNCFDAAITIDNILEFSECNENLAISDEERFVCSFVSFLYNMKDLLDLAKKDIRARLQSGIGIEADKIKRAMREYAEFDDAEFVKFIEQMGGKE